MRKILGLGAVVLVLCLLWTGGWFWLAGQARQQVLLLGAADGETTPRLTCGGLDVTGFPFRFDLECRDALLVDRDLSVGVSGVRASVLAYNPTHVVFSAQGPASIDDAFTGSTSRLDFTGLQGSARLTASDWLASLSGTGWRIARVSTVVDGLRWTDTTTAEVERFRAAHAELHLLDMPERHDKAGGMAALALFAEAREIDAPLLEVAAGTASVEAEITGLPNDLMVLANDPDPLRNWQRRAGTVKLVRIAGNQPQPEESYEVSGELALDDAGLLTGQLAYTTRGVLDRLAGMVPPLQLAALKGLPRADGSYANSLGIVDGQVKLVGIPLFSVGPAF